MPALEISRTISPNDEMWEGWPGYFDVGEDALRLIQAALDGAEPRRILDLPCGHGRVLRWLRAEWPEAEITACDLNRDGVDFCASEFGVKGVYSSVDPEAIPLGRYDVIWCGSLLTHVDATLWERFLKVFAEHLDGVLVFTTAGPTVAELMRQGELTESVVEPDALLDSYDRTGFGYADYHDQSYGLARATPAWVRNLLARLPLQVVNVVERDWADRQDVYTVLPANPR